MPGLGAAVRSNQQAGLGGLGIAGGLQPSAEDPWALSENDDGGGVDWGVGAMGDGVDEGGALPASYCLHPEDEGEGTNVD